MGMTELGEDRAGRGRQNFEIGDRNCRRCGERKPLNDALAGKQRQRGNAHKNKR